MTDIFGEIRPEGSQVSDEKKKADARARYAEKKAMKLATGEKEPKIGKSANPTGRPKSIVNRVTEYGTCLTS